MLNVNLDKKFTNKLNGSNDTSMNHLPPPGSLVALVGGSYNGLFAIVSTSYTPASARLWGSPTMGEINSQCQRR
jgi:hypothetical protein